MTGRTGDWIQTHTGTMFYPLDPRVEDIDIHDIAHALSMQPRYAGHTRRFYSVAEHSIYIAKACSPEHALWGLLHDASEAYLCDIPRPIKPYLTNYAEIEARLMHVICEKFGLSPTIPEEIKRLDRAILRNEYEGLLAPHPSQWGLQYDGIPDVVIRDDHELPHNLIKAIFLEWFFALNKG